MAELEKEQEIENPELEDNTSEEPETETTGEEEITYEQAMKWKEDLKKASGKIAELKKEVPKKKEKLEQKTDTNKDLEMRLFFIENPEFKEDKDGIMEILSDEKYKNLTPEEAQALYKLKKPKQSETIKNDFGGGTYKPKPKTIGEISEEEALKLSPPDYIKRLKATGELK